MEKIIHVNAQNNVNCTVLDITAPRAMHVHIRNILSGFVQAMAKHTVLYVAFLLIGTAQMEECI